MDKKNLNFITCSHCDGAGASGGEVCDNCRGAGVGLILRDRILYWGKQYDEANLGFAKISRRFKMVYNMLLAIFAVSGIAWLAYFGYDRGFETFFSLQYWFTPSVEKLYFWITLLIALYLYYRLEKEISMGNFVMKRKYDDTDVWHEQLTFNEVWQDYANKTVDISDSFTEDALRSVETGWRLAKHFGHHEMKRAHFFGVLPEFDKSAIILGRLGIDFSAFKTKVSNYLMKNILSRSGKPVLSANMRKLLLLAYYNAYEDSLTKVSVVEAVQALASPQDIDLQVETDDVEELLIEMGFDYQKLINVVAWIRIQEQLRRNLQHFRGRARYKPKSGLDRAMTAQATPLLNKISEDLTLKAKYGSLFPCIGRDAEMERIFQIMEGSREGVLLNGSLGVGKTAIIHGLAQRMAIEDVPEILQDKRLVSLSVSRLLAGADAATAEQRILQVTDEIIRSGNIVLAVEDLHNLTGITAGGDSSLDLAEVFADIARKGLFHIIATTNPTDYGKAIENTNLDSAFQLIQIKEMEINDAIWVLEAKSGVIEYQNKVYFSYGAIEKAARLSDRYIHDRRLPDKAIEILEATAIKVRKEKGENKVVRADDVAQVVSNMTNIPLTEVSESETEKLLHLEQKIHERMIGQDPAVDMVAKSIRRARAELREGKRPIASMLFLGPTGVGKTELAKTVAEVYYGREDAMIRIDMSEYQEKSSLDRMLGRGDNPGILTEQVRKNPFSLLLFDEVEKAHPDILNVFLQLMDDGRLTDAQGRTVDFTNTIVIMTSNAGAHYIQDQIKAGVDIESVKTHLLENELRESYRPEFLNRFDGVIVFKPLSLTDVIKIARLMVGRVVKRLDEKGIEFAVTDAALAELAEVGFDPKFGARPLRRVIQEKVEDALANRLLKGDISRRDKVFYDVGGELRIEKAPEI